MNQGNLRHVVKTNQLEDKAKFQIALEIAKGMNYLHGLKPPILHRDLKPSNIMVDSAFNVKICDFGIARIYDNHHTYLKSHTTVPTFAAPEILNNEPYDEKVDVYSYAFVLW